MTLVRDVMTRDVQCLNPDASVQQAAWRMLELDVGALPVCRGDELIGMITDRDITIRAVAHGQDPRSTTIDDVMSPRVIWCFDDADVSEVAQRMREEQVRRIPVVDRQRHLVGIVSLGDLASRVDDPVMQAQALEGISLPTGP